MIEQVLQLCDALLYSRTISAESLFGFPLPREWLNVFLT